MQAKDMWEGNDLSFSQASRLWKVLQGVHNSRIACSFSLAFLCSLWTSRKHIAPVCSVSLSGSEAQEDKRLTCAHTIAHVSKADTYNAPFLSVMSHAPEESQRKMRASYTYSCVWSHLNLFILSAAFFPKGSNRCLQLSTWGPDSGSLAVLAIKLKSFWSLAQSFNQWGLIYSTAKTFYH